MPTPREGPSAAEGEVEVALEYRATELDSDGNQQGYQDLVTGLKSTEYVATGFAAASAPEPRLRVKATNPSGTTAGPEVPITLGKTQAGLKIPAGWWNNFGPGRGKPFDCLQQLIATEDGRLYYTYHRPGQVLEQQEILGLQQGEWTAGESYAVGDISVTFVDFTFGGTVLSLPFSWRCIKAHTAALDATSPSGAGNEWWEPAEEHARSGDLPTPPAPAADGDDDDVPAAESLHTLDYDTAMPALTGEAHQPDRAGEYKLGSGGFGYQAAGAVDATYRAHGQSWTKARDQTTTIGICLLDADGVDRESFHHHLNATSRERHMTLRWAEDCWIRYRIDGMRISADGDRCVFRVVPLIYNETGGIGDFPDAVEIRFNVAPPTETVP